jgi:hypothetical protein
MIGKVIQKLVLLTSCAVVPVLSIAQDGLSEEELRQFLLSQPVPENPFGYAPVVAVIGLFAVIIAAMFFASQREKRKQDLLVQFVEKDQQIPQELLPPQPSRKREVRRGVWLLALGIGLGLVLFIASGEWATAAWSLIPFLLAVASFVNAAFFYPDSRPRERAQHGE